MTDIVVRLTHEQAAALLSCAEAGAEDLEDNEPAQELAGDALDVLRAAIEATC